MTDRQPNAIQRIVKSAAMIEANELRTVSLSFLLVFILMAAYYILRPVRDAMASDWSNTEISVLWNIQLLQLFSRIITRLEAQNQAKKILKLQNSSLEQVRFSESIY